MKASRNQISLMLLTIGALPMANGADDVGTLDVHQRELLTEYCLTCHNLDDWSGGLALDSIYLEEISRNAETWERVVRKLRGRLMPPPGNPQPDNDDLASFVRATEHSLDLAAAKVVAPGHMGM